MADSSNISVLSGLSRAGVHSRNRRNRLNGRCPRDRHARSGDSGLSTINSVLAPHARQIILALALITSLTLIDFLSFVHRIEHPVTAPVTGAQAIVALTGGGGHRVRASLELGHRLNLPVFISGVTSETRPPEKFAKHYRLPAHTLKTLKLELGTSASTTEENGLETARWARHNAYQHLIIVTSNFHMERSLIELRRSMPEIKPLPAPVPTLVLNAGDWWKNSRTATLIAEEWITMRIAGLRAFLIPHKSSRL